MTVPDLPEMNGLAERMNRTILEKAKCMCAHADLPRCLWAEAASTAAYVYNHLPNAPLKGKKPLRSLVQPKARFKQSEGVWLHAYALVPAAKRRKFDDRTEKMRFLGYHKGHRGHKLMEKGSNQEFHRTDVTFAEYNFCLSPEKPAEREVEAPTVEMDVGSSGRRASQPVRVPAKVTARQPVDPVRGSQSLWLNIRRPSVTENQ